MLTSVVSSLSLKVMAQMSTHSLADWMGGGGGFVRGVLSDPGQHASPGFHVRLTLMWADWGGGVGFAVLPTRFAVPARRCDGLAFLQ